MKSTTIDTENTTLCGVLALGEDRSLLHMLCFVLIIAGIAGLKLLSPKRTPLGGPSCKEAGHEIAQQSLPAAATRYWPGRLGSLSEVIKTQVLKNRALGRRTPRIVLCTQSQTYLGCARGPAALPASRTERGGPGQFRALQRNLNYPWKQGPPRPSCPLQRNQKMPAMTDAFVCAGAGTLA